MRRSPCISWLSLVVLLVPCLAAAPASRPVDREQRERAAFEAELKRLPVLPRMTVADLVSFDVVAGHLQVLTRAPVTSAASLVPVTGAGGIFTLTNKLVGHDAAPPPPYQPDFFLLERYEFNVGLVGDTGTTVEVLPGSLQVSQTVEGTLGMRQVTLIEQAPAGVEPGVEGAGIMLRVTAEGAAKDGERTNVEIRDRDFAALRRDYPTEVAEHLEPVFRLLHADGAVLAPDRALAYEALAKAVPRDPATVERVRQLIAKLDADDAGERDAAGRDLARMGPPAAVIASEVDRAHLSPEQASRLDAFLHANRPVAQAKADQLRGNPDFLLNCLNSDDSLVARTAWSELRTVAPGLGAFDFDLAGQARRDVVWKLREHLRATQTAAASRPAVALPAATRP